MRIHHNSISVLLKKYWEIAIVLLLSLILFCFAAIANNLFNKVMSAATFLTWHSLFEFVSIFSAFSIFIVTYYTYEENRSLRMIIFSCAFLFMGAIDVFHTLSYKGMADFFIANTSANRATTFWILSRMIGSIGLLAGFTVSKNKTINISKMFFIIPSLILILSIFITVTYYPYFLPTMFIDGYGLTNVKIILEYVIILILIITLLKVIQEYKKTKLSKEYLFIIGILMSIFSEIAFVSYASVYDAYNYLGHMYKLISYFILFQAIYTTNVKMPYREMLKAKNALKEYSENLDILVQQRTKELADINDKLIMDLEYARQMQRSLLPSKMPDEPSMSFNSFYLPAERLSGDFYNVIKLDEHNIAIYIGDVAGHGVSAAMLTVFANQNIKPIKEASTSVEILSPSDVLKNLYKTFNQTNFNDETYLVMLYGIYNTQSRNFLYSSAGINVPPFIIKESGELQEIDATGFAICKLGRYFTPSFENKIVKLDHGDKVLFYTDGLIEINFETGDKYHNAFFNTLKESSSLNGNDFSDKLKKDFYTRIGKEELIKDDATFLVMEVY